MVIFQAENIRVNCCICRCSTDVVETFISLDKYNCEMNVKELLRSKLKSDVKDVINLYDFILLVLILDDDFSSDRLS